MEGVAVDLDDQAPVAPEEVDLPAVELHVRLGWWEAGGADHAEQPPLGLGSGEGAVEVSLGRGGGEVEEGSGRRGDRDPLVTGGVAGVEVAAVDADAGSLARL